MKKIYVGCLAHRHTGGLTLAHQLCYELRSQGFDAAMYYYYGWRQEKTNPVNENYKKYNLPFVTKIEDNKDNIVVAPETFVNLLRGVKMAKKVIWWMSVDNYFKTLKSPRDRIINWFGLRPFNIRRKDIIHLAQSYYAIDFLKKQGIQEESIYYLSDYLDETFLLDSEKYANAKKENVVLYNPRKGKEFTAKLMEVGTDITWCPLQNMTPTEVKEKLGTSKVYIDFGEHPGKDRIPREAAVMGCCVITGKRGSAYFYEDVSIPDDYKFNDTESSIPMILKQISECFADYERKRKDFCEYVAKIKSERVKFTSDVAKVFNAI